ncbi:MAG: magnesium transporter [Alphaproteobacteria bacterium]
MNQAASSASIRRYVVTDVPLAAPSETAATVRGRMIGRHHESADLIFVLDEARRVLGVVPIATLLATDGETAIAALMRRDWPVVGEADDREAAASVAIRHGVPGLAACDSSGRFLGAIRAADLMAILRDEHLEDLHHMAGILHHTEAARAALTAPPYRRALHRLPWLIVGVLGSGLATAVMARFEEALAANITIAFFVPAIVYLADAVGTQSEATAVRGLSVADGPVRGLLVGELGTGALIGTTLAALVFPLVLVLFGSVALAATVALSVLVAGTIATVLGIMLPLAIQRLGFDPAHGSGPVGTVVQDVLSLLTYFTFAGMLLV